MKNISYFKKKSDRLKAENHFYFQFFGERSFSLILAVMMLAIVFVLITAFLSFSTRRVKISLVRGSFYKVDLVKDSVVNTSVQEVIKVLASQDNVLSAGGVGQDGKQYYIPLQTKSFYLSPSPSSKKQTSWVYSSGISDAAFRLPELLPNGSSVRNDEIENSDFWKAPQLGDLDSSQIPRWIYLRENGKSALEPTETKSQQGTSVRYGFTL
ncbi:MAG: hypothetical protein V4507_04090, partial [Verrucomicrobiota bacterium]